MAAHARHLNISAVAPADMLKRTKAGPLMPRRMQVVPVMSVLQRSSSSTCPDLFGILLRYLDALSGLYILSLRGDTQLEEKYFKGMPIYLLENSQ